MISFTVQIAVVCCASYFVETRKSKLEQIKAKEDVRSFLQAKSLSQKCTVDDYIKVNSYIAKYYDSGLLLEFVTAFEDTMNEEVDIDTLTSFLDNPIEMKDQITIMIPANERYKAQIISIS